VAGITPNFLKRDGLARWFADDRFAIVGGIELLVPERAKAPQLAARRAIPDFG
jgi:hypothetical protein